MAYMVRRKNEMWELREALTTRAGPRSRTLVTFRSLAPEVVGLALERASKPLTHEAVRRAARRAGAPIDLPTADRAAADLLAEIDAGRAPRPVLSALLLEALGGEKRSEVPEGVGDGARVSDSAQAAAAWISASLERRGRTLQDLLDLADHLPARRRPTEIGFPRLRSKETT